MGIVRKIIIVICLIVFVGAGGVLAKYFIDAYNEMNKLTDLKNMELLKDLETENGTIIGKYVPIWQKNHDLIGWITIEGTKIDFPVMQTKDDPEYYLRRNFDGEYSTEGVPFMDANSDIFLPTSNFLIYGHNMRNGTMFHDIVKYKDADFYNSHMTIKFDTIYKGGQGTYQVIAAGYSRIKDESEEGFRYYQCAGISTQEEFDEYIAGVKSESSYDTGIVPEYGDQLITLSTCTNDNNEGRFYVVAVRTDAKAGPPQN